MLPFLVCRFATRLALSLVVLSFIVLSCRDAKEEAPEPADCGTWDASSYDYLVSDIGWGTPTGVLLEESLLPEGYELVYDLPLSAATAGDEEFARQVAEDEYATGRVRSFARGDGEDLVLIVSVGSVLVDIETATSLLEHPARVEGIDVWREIDFARFGDESHAWFYEAVDGSGSRLQGHISQFRVGPLVLATLVSGGSGTLSEGEAREQLALLTGQVCERLTEELATWRNQPVTPAVAP